jgi:hypothetical protein
MDDIVIRIHSVELAKTSNKITKTIAGISSSFCVLKNIQGGAFSALDAGGVIALDAIQTLGIAIFTFKRRSAILAFVTSFNTHVAEI